MVLVHRDGTRTDLQILRLLERLADGLRIIAASALDRVDEHLARIVAEGREDVRRMAVFLRERIDEALHGLIFVGVMRAEIRVVQRIRTGDVRDLRIIPAVRAEDRAGDAELARLLHDLADLLIVGRNEDDIRVRRLERRQRRLEIRILRDEGLLVEHLAARGLELLLEHLAEALGVVRAVIYINNRRLCLEVLRGELRHDGALLRIDEAAAEDVRLHLAVLHRDIRARRIRRDDRHLVVRRDLRLGDDVRRDRRADDDLDLVIRDELRRRVDGLRCLRLVVGIDDRDLLAVDAARVIDFLDRELQTVERRRAVVRDIARHLEVRADLDLVALRLIAAAREYAAHEQRAEQACCQSQMLPAEIHKNPSFPL